MVRRQLSRPVDYQVSDTGFIGFIRKVLSEKLYQKSFIRIVLSEKIYHKSFITKDLLEKFYLKSILSEKYFIRRVLSEKYYQKVKVYFLSFLVFRKVKFTYILSQLSSFQKVCSISVY
ncbi:hypothetical protein ACOSP7_004711 [Xanthoceras sorbifolium]